VDYHLERGLRLHTEPEYKNLYEWAINEIDAHGRKVGDDQIPWPWALYFTATSCVLGDSFEIEPDYQNEETEPRPSKVEQQQVIRIQLRPTGARGDEDLFGKTSFSMFGTDRTIKRFELNIHPISDAGISGSKDRTERPGSLGAVLKDALDAVGHLEDPRTERCTAWGCVSYTAEIDFRNETIDDGIIFYLYVKPETFARYGAKVAHGLVDEIVLRVGKVSGFYSEWSPSISTGRVKVLTRGGEQKITLPPGLQFEPPRLGRVGEARLYINRRLEFRQRAPSETVEAVADVGTERSITPQMQAPAAMDPRILQLLGSLRRAAWFIVFLLALIFIITLSKH
jgi:hypothetical protein